MSIFFRFLIWFAFSILIFGSQNSLSAKESTNKGENIDVDHNSTARTVDFKFSNHDYDTESQHRQLASSNRGMTWGRMLHNDEYGYDYVHCVGGGVNCAAYSGDTLCSSKLPILCKNVNGAKRPPYNVGACSTCANVLESYSGWVNGNLAVTSPIRGERLTSRMVGNNICAKQLGTDWTMVEHHNGKYKIGMSNTTYVGKKWTRPFLKGGWGVYGFGNVGNASRFWVAINDQNANCWNSVP